MHSASEEGADGDEDEDEDEDDMFERDDIDLYDEKVRRGSDVVVSHVTAVPLTRHLLFQTLPSTRSRPRRWSS